MTLTFAEFQGTRRAGELATLLPEMDLTDYPATGLVYADGLYIFQVDAPDGQWLLELDRDGWCTDDLESLERRLYAFGCAEGYIDNPDAPADPWGPESTTK